MCLVQSDLMSETLQANNFQGEYQLLNHYNRINFQLVRQEHLLFKTQQSSIVLAPLFCMVRKIYIAMDGCNQPLVVFYSDTPNGISRDLGFAEPVIDHSRWQ